MPGKRTAQAPDCSAIVRVECELSAINGWARRPREARISPCQFRTTRLSIRTATVEGFPSPPRDLGRHEGASALSPHDQTKETRLMNEPTPRSHYDRQRPTSTIVPATVATITAHEIDRWSCHCGNAPHSGGFDPVDQNGNAVEPTPEQWPEPLYICNECGLVVDAGTFDATAHTVAVIGRVPK